MSRAYCLGIMAAILFGKPDSLTGSQALASATWILDAAEAQEQARLEREIEEARK